MMATSPTDSKTTQIVFGNEKRFVGVDIKDTLLAYAEISVTDTEKRCGINSMSMKDVYTAYRIETKITDENYKGDIPRDLCIVWRRYTDFEILRNFLSKKYPFILVPPLPEKKVTYVWQQLPVDIFDPDFIERRKEAFQKFLLRLASHPVLSKDHTFSGFLYQDEEWKEVITSTGLKEMADSTIKSWNVALRLRNPDKSFIQAKNYANELSSSIGNLLRIRSKIADREYGIHKIHANYGRVFGELATMEKEEEEKYQNAAHQMKLFSAAIDSYLEEEEEFVDSMKEYLNFADSLKLVCRNQEIMQYELEKAEDSLAIRLSQKEHLEQGTSSFVSRLLRTESDLDKETRLQILNQAIQQAETQIRLASNDKKEFQEKALKEVERFHKQKDLDLKEALRHYVQNRINVCQKNLLIWNNFRKCFTDV